VNCRLEQQPPRHGGGEDFVEIRCTHCLRWFYIGNNCKTSEAIETISADRLFHTPKADLESFGALQVTWDFQMAVTREAVEARLREVNPKLLERIEFVELTPRNRR
jgi:hypothetical protein